ncbi:hypothetical protein F5Y11DRAFT_150106 [Daldinia sp. FL1419]|nr:hypothetical protein F5Y11DRAFT_150106 [Daldinia sp. FL1419]
MATSKSSSASTSKGAPTGNPAPDFNVNMNRIQMQLEARMKAARAFLPSRSDLNNPSASSSGGSFSALSSNSGSSNPYTQSKEAAAAAAARRAAEEAEFAEERGLDPNVGIGLNRSSAAKDENVSGADRETARLRGRLLGKKGRDGTGTNDQNKWVRKEDSSDEEAGRSGLGRAKRNSGKRTRAEMETQEESGDPVSSATPASAPASALPTEPKASNAHADGGTEARDAYPHHPKHGTETAVPEPAIMSPPKPDSNHPPSQENPNKKRKKKKKKSKAREGTGGEVAS